MKKQWTGFLTSIMIVPATFFIVANARAAPQELPNDLTELSIEELADLEVTSVAKKPQKISLSAAAVHVITNEDIRRSGARCIPEALRMAPGLDVAKINANQWAVSARGFNGTYANKLLVLIDGRTVYSPFFSGVFWLTQDTLLEDIDRIEVIRGPGASLWGANAVNGIINIITKHTENTKGGLVSTGLGTEERAFLDTRYGGEINDRGAYRIFAKGFLRDESKGLNDEPAGDDYYKIQSGFRTDQTLSDRNDITIQGDIYKAEVKEDSHFPSYMPSTYRTDFSTENPYTGGNILGRWTHRFSRESDCALQIYYDNMSMSEYGFDLHVDTIDVDFQNRFQVGKHQEIMWGWGYRYSSDRTDAADFFSMDPQNRTTNLFSLFLQDEIAVIKDALFLTLGSKIEHNDYTGFEYQPNARILLTFNNRHTFWAAVSRATRSLSRIENDMNAILSMLPPSTSINTSPFPAAVAYVGNDDAKSETLIAHELGYRIQADSHVVFDITIFYNLYDELIDTSLMETVFDPSPQPHVIIPFQFDNLIKGNTRGCELSAWWKPYHALRFQTAYTFLDMDLKAKTDDILGGGINQARLSPDHQISFNTAVNLPRHLETDLWFRYIDNILDGLVDSYTTMDMRIGWTPGASLSFFIVGQNLLEEKHIEFKEETGRINTAQVERSVYAGMTWTF